MSNGDWYCCRSFTDSSWNGLEKGCECNGACKIDANCPTSCEYCVKKYADALSGRGLCTAGKACNANCGQDSHCENSDILAWLLNVLNAGKGPAACSKCIPTTATDDLEAYGECGGMIRILLVHH